MIDDLHQHAHHCGLWRGWGYCTCGEKHRQQARIRAAWITDPDSEAKRAARGEVRSPRLAAAGGDVDEMTPAERIRYYEDCIRGARADLCAVAPDHSAEDDRIVDELACSRQREPDPTHTPAVRRVVAWETFEGSRALSIVGAYNRAAGAIMSGAGRDRMAYARFLRRQRELSCELSWDARAERWVRVRDRLAAYLRHRDEKAGYQ